MVESESRLVRTMVLSLDGDSEYAATAQRKIGLFGEKNPICKCSRSNQMP